jgi:hypothetical protein
MMGCRFLARMGLLVLFLAAAILPEVARAGEVHNNLGKYDGLYRATVINRTQDQVFEEVEVDLEGRYIEVRLPDASIKMKITEMWDRRYQMEITARDSESGDLYIVQIKT